MALRGRRIENFENISLAACSQVVEVIEAIEVDEAVEASQCYFFENWLMKHKWATLVNMQLEIYDQNYQSFYPSEPFTLDHIIMRHPVIQDETLQCHIYLESEHFLNNINN